MDSPSSGKRHRKKTKENNRGLPHVKPLFRESELYPGRHRRKFTSGKAGFQVVKDP